MKVGDKVVLTERGERTCGTYLSYRNNKNKITYGTIRTIEEQVIRVNFIDYKGFVKSDLYLSILTNGISNFAFYEQ